MPSPPEWLQELADAAALQMIPADILAPVGCHFCCVDGTWEVSLFATSTQIVGGKHDGILRPSRFHVDLQAITKLFSEVHDLTWQALPLAADDDLGSHIVVIGTCAGQSVALRILSRSPRQFVAGRRAIVYENAWEEIW
jgi:hypothetical protein